MALDEPQDSGGVPEWVVTFGDMMSLLLTFFIMLFSMSEIKQEQKYQAVLESLRRTFGYDTAVLSSAPGSFRPRNADLEKLASLGRARRASLMKGGAPVNAPVGDYPRVTAVTLDGNPAVAGVVFFKKDSDELSEANKTILQSIAHRVAGIPQKIEIRGHTSNHPLPPDSPFRDHWDLAYARCRRVEQFLVTLGINPQRIRLGVAAGNELRYTGTDRLLQEENPRVEILLLGEAVTSNTAGHAAERADNDGRTTPTPP